MSGDSETDHVARRSAQLKRQIFSTQRKSPPKHRHDYPRPLLLLRQGALDLSGLIANRDQVIGDKWEQYLLYVQECSEG